MRIFETVKAAATTRMAAEHYGLKVERNGMTSCPFHSDKHPSMKVDDRYYCFGCHETGDVIDFTAKLFSLNPMEAAKKLAYDFGIDPHSPETASMKRPVQRCETQRAREGRCASVLIDYERLLKKRQARYAPRNRIEEWDGRYASACHSLPQVSYFIDCLFSPDKEKREKAAASVLHDGTITRIQTWMQHHTKEMEDDPHAEEARVA